MGGIKVHEREVRMEFLGIWRGLERLLHLVGRVDDQGKETTRDGTCSGQGKDPGGGNHAQDFPVDGLDTTTTAKTDRGGGTSDTVSG
jgi:hypothetical protein